MPLYRVTVPVTAETYARTPEDAARQARAAISVDSRVASAEPGTPLLGKPRVSINPRRNPERRA